MISFEEFCADPNLLNEPISPAWVAAYKLLDGEPLTQAEAEIARQICGDDFGTGARRELVAVKGRRSEGTKTACKYLLWKIHGSGNEFRQYAAPRDRLIVPIVAQVRDTAKEIFQYLRAFYDGSAILGQEVENSLATSIELKSGFILTVSTCSYRAPRGVTAPLALLDEVGVWRVEGSDVDKEVYRSLRPAMVQFPNRKVIILGTPWMKAGVLFDAWQEREEIADRLVIKAPTALMNPRISAEELERERVADPENFRREFEAEWLDDVDSFIPSRDIDANVMAGVREVAAVERVPHIATIDASGLTGKDRFTFAIGHLANSGVKCDLLRAWSRQSPSFVCEEIAAICEKYSIRTITCDQFGFGFLRELMRQHGIELQQLAFTSRSKPEIFIDLKLALSQGNFSLLDHPEALRELRMLESKRTSGGHVTIAAPRGQHDDYAAVLALLAHRAKTRKGEFRGMLFVQQSDIFKR